MKDSSDGRKAIIRVNQRVQCLVKGCGDIPSRGSESYQLCDYHFNQLSPIFQIETTQKVLSEVTSWLDSMIAATEALFGLDSPANAALLERRNVYAEVKSHVDAASKREMKKE